MKRMLIVAIAVVALMTTATADASAQSYNNGYGFGSGVRQTIRQQGNIYGGGCFAGNFGYRNRGVIDRISQPPYFAQFPPVYYSGIVRRPYGVSPFAAPPGIAPVELNMPVEGSHPITIKNPYATSTPVSAPKKRPVRVKKAEAKKIDNQTTWVKNPFFVTEAAEIAEVKSESVLLSNSNVTEIALIDLVELAMFK